MFYYVNGTVAETGPNLAVIDCGGVGYACATTNYTLSQLKKGERAKLYTHLHVREDIFELYGFSSQAELNSFRMLIGDFKLDFQEAKSHIIREYHQSLCKMLPSLVISL